MRKISLVIVKPKDHKPGKAMLGFPSRLVDSETGEEFGNVQDITLNLPLGGAMTVTATIVIGDVTVEDKCVAPPISTAVQNPNGRPIDVTCR